MPRNVAPVCDIDWARYFSLPVAVPPSGITAAERVQYAGALDVTATTPISTHGRYFKDPPAAEVRGVGAASRVLLPRHGRDLVPASRETLSAATMNERMTLLGTTAFQPAAPAPGSVSAVDAKLQDKVPTDPRALSFSPMPIPRLGVDSVEMYFETKPVPWLPATLAINQLGILDINGMPSAAVPELLLTTSKTSLGELDRLLLRSPVSGRFRFDPYYLYRWSGATTLEVIGPSSTGRLLIEQPPLSTARSVEGTHTLLFEARTFAFDHVSRADVSEFVHALLAFQLRHLEALNAAHKNEAGAEARLAIPGSSPEVMGWVVAGVSRMLRAWTAFLSVAVLRWRIEDITAAEAIPATWTATLKKGEPKASDAAALILIATQVIGSANLLESLMFFSRNVYARRLAGYSWTEVLALNGQNAARFPVPSDQPPFTANDAVAKAAKEQHQRLRLIEDPNQRWVACWAGAPLGRPAPVYASAAPGTAFPVDGVTTYELEALHAGDLAAAVFGVAAPAPASKPTAGRAGDLSAYTGKQVGHACWFTAGTIATNPLHTTTDWLLELTRGTHFTNVEEPFVDLMSLVDKADPRFRGHPLVAPLRADQHEKAVHLRRQMDAAGMEVLGIASLGWWDSKVGFTKVGTKWHHLNADGTDNDKDPSPRKPYNDDQTHPAALSGVLSFDDLIFGSPTGFDTFDIESAWLATERMRVSPDRALPLPVVLALMEREGVKQFAAINRRVRYTRTEGATLLWEALRRADIAPVARLRATYPGPDVQMAREAWLSYPYGLDHYATPNTDDGVDGRTVLPADAVIGMSEGLSGAVKAGVIALDPDESVGRYISSRVFGTFVPSPAPIGPRGTPRIWKLHRRMHWAGISLMVAYFREIEAGILGNTSAFVNGAWTRNASWVAPPPDLTGKTPADTEWKDYLSYYGMVYIGYNGGPSTWADTIKTAETAMVGSPLQYRDFLLFKHRRDRVVIGNMVRFVIGLDAFLRLRYLDNEAPQNFAAASADTTAAATRTVAKWGV
ncbi:hypothetical protein [Nitrospira defluvii]|uniref:Uncharacterized protein n=1 Tax=Nitrospira defluvii TaxID=330214 RepID=A0ABM8S8H0_9BACT|nr:hypothetical protein [Nitrospira defluvii]CAE6794391.1 hypothetical protein NSPZN2_70019 [Nitrospira defluvii]